MGADGWAGIIGGRTMLLRLTLKDASITLPLLLQTDRKKFSILLKHTEEYGEAPTNFCSLV